MTQPLRARVGAIFGLLGSAALGWLSRSGALSAWWAKYLGVVFWACGLYWLVRAIGGPRLGRSRSALLAVMGSWAVEFMQLTSIPRWLSSRHPLLRAAVGEVFSLWDLPAYLVGVGLAVALDAILVGRESQRQRASG